MKASKSMKKLSAMMLVVIVIGIAAVIVFRQSDRTPSKITEMVERDANAKTIRIISPSDMVLKYDIEQKNDDTQLLQSICGEGQQPDVMQTKAAVIRQRVDYFVVKKQNHLKDYMSSVDCECIGQVASYDIYRVRNNYYDAISDEAEIRDIEEQTGIVKKDYVISLSGRKVEETNRDEIIAEYILLNDLHMMLTTDDTTEEHRDTIYQRYSGWALTSTGVHSADLWQNLSAILDSYQADGVLMAGDMVDFASGTNYELFQRGLEKIRTKILYARSDHDMSAWYNSDGSYTNQNAYDEQTNISSKLDNLEPMQDIMAWETSQYMIVAWNNSTYQMSQQGLQRVKELFSKGKPIILLTHVPIDSPIDKSLYETAKQVDPENRAKLWGEECLYVPDDVTTEFLQMVEAETSPVCVVLSGHLHFEAEVMLNSHCKEIVFAPSFAGNIARLVIVE